MSVKVLEPADASGAGSRVGAARTLLARPFYRILFAALCASFTLLYTVLLPFAYTQRLSFHNWRYLNPELAGFSLVFGLLLGWIATLQIYALSCRARGRPRGLSAGATVVGLLPGLLCCTPVVPSLLAALGASTAGIYGLSGPIQGFFAVHETDFLAGSALLLAVAAAWSTRLAGRSTCPVAPEVSQP